MENTKLRELLQRGLVIPASPLALKANRALDERRQRRELERLLKRSGFSDPDGKNKRP